MQTPVLDVFRPGFWRVCRAYFGLELRGIERIPASGPLLITPNHQTFADPPLVSIPVRRPIYYMAWNRLFTIPLFGWFIQRLRAFPVALDGSDPRATRHAVRLLRHGHALMIFPEGERTTTGAVGRFKLGAFRLSVSVGAPVLPVTIAGGHAAWPPGRTLPRPGRITITYHALEHPDPALEPRDAARELARRTRAVIAGALGASTRE